jgi:Fur family ferric uptake transcriptional regulator
MIIKKVNFTSRHTDQRRLVLGALKTMPGTPTAEEVWKRVRTVRPSVGLATVYRNLKLLKERGEILEVSGGPGQRFAGFVVQRGVFRCQRCGEEAVTERIELPVDVVVPDGARSLGYEIAVTGLCANCRKDLGV